MTQEIEICDAAYTPGFGTDTCGSRELADDVRGPAVNVHTHRRGAVPEAEFAQSADRLSRLSVVRQLPLALAEQR